MIRHRAELGFGAADLADLATTDGGFGNRQIDLFASYSATATLRDVGRRPTSHLATARTVLSRASARGMGETVGAQEDAWSTSYASGILVNLGYVAPRRWASFLTSLERDGGYSMFPGGEPDAWATGFAARAHGSFDPALVKRTSLARWVGSAQALDGGITWTPGAAKQNAGDVRATGFSIEALHNIDAVHLLDGYADMEALIEFLIGRQTDGGGFALNAESSPCMWATGEAVAALDALAIPIPNSANVIDFVMTYFDESAGGFRRGPAYRTRADVWATRQAVRVLKVLDPDRLSALASRVSEFIGSCELPHGGFTYTDLRHAGDVLSTSAAVLAGYGDTRSAEWIAACVMPGDDGFAYMPGRGAEARTSQWATAALTAVGVPYNTGALLTWASHAQNLDGGFGRWAGRVSEPISTAATTATLAGAGILGELPGIAALAGWVDTAINQIPGSTADAVVAGNLVRAARAIATASNADIDISPCLRVIDELEVHGAFRRSVRAVPDLATTYAVLVAHQAIGDSRGIAAAHRWVDDLSVYPNGVAWSPASSDGGGLLATALATLIVNAADGESLPDLSL